jgi:hypothetical protein
MQLVADERIKSTDAFADHGFCFLWSKMLTMTWAMYATLAGVPELWFGVLCVQRGPVLR